MLQRTRDVLMTSVAGFKAAATNGDATALPYKIKGNGLWHRKLYFDDLMAFAVDACVGRLELSHLTAEQSSRFFGLPRWRIKAGVRAHKNDNGNANGNGADHATFGADLAAAMPEDAEGNTLVAVESTTADTVPVSDIHETRIALRRFAASLGCRIEQVTVEAGPNDGFPDYGSYVLLDETEHLVWPGGLPIAGIAEALKCLAHEHRLPEENKGEAWTNFGSSWKR